MTLEWQELGHDVVAVVDPWDYYQSTELSRRCRKRNPSGQNVFQDAISKIMMLFLGSAFFF